MENYQRIFRARPSNYRLINYEVEVYRLIYGRDPLMNLTLNYRRPKKEYLGLYWDNMIPENSIKALVNISEIEIVDLNQGHDSKLLTHCIFRPLNQDRDYIETIVKQLNINNTKSKYDIGVGNRLIVYVATKNWYRPDAVNTQLFKWWESLPNKIKKAI